MAKSVRRPSIVSAETPRYPPPMRYFEDIEVGLSIEVGRHVVSKEEIVGFASQWDPQPFHVDEEAARDSVFGGLSASSCHTYSISSLIFSRAAELKTKAAAMMGMKMKFPTPVRPGDELTLREVCLDKRLSRSRPRYGIVKSRASMVNAAGAEVMVCQSSYLVERREPAPLEEAH
ncbi:MAG: MaoC/PaaZ C-terminal domain-containing protein [Myxococcota bacterium]